MILSKSVHFFFFIFHIVWFIELLRISLFTNVCAIYSIYSDLVGITNLQQNVHMFLFHIFCIFDQMLSPIFSLKQLLLLWLIVSKKRVHVCEAIWLFCLYIIPLEKLPLSPKCIIRAANTWSIPCMHAYDNNRPFFNSVVMAISK